MIKVFKLGCSVPNVRIVGVVRVVKSKSIGSPISGVHTTRVLGGFYTLLAVLLWQKSDNRRTNAG